METTTTDGYQEFGWESSAAQCSDANLLIALSGHSDGHYQPGRVGGHIKFFTRRSLTVLMEQHGFVGVDFAGAGRIPGLWKSMVITARRRG